MPRVERVDAAAAADSKRAVQRYFDDEADGYLETYRSARAGDARRDVFQQRRDLVLEMTPRTARLVLDVGAGPGVFTRQLLDRGASCWAVDLSHQMAATARRQFPGESRARFMVGDIDRLPFAAGAFDAVLCVGVLQYLASADEAIREMARVLAPGGCAIVTFPNAASPLNRLHRAAVGTARSVRRATERLGVAAAKDPSRLTFRTDIPNRWFAAADLESSASASGLIVDSVAYHVLQFPFAIPGLGAPIRAWNERVRGRFPRGRRAVWGREGIMRLVRPA